MLVGRDLPTKPHLRDALLPKIGGRASLHPPNWVVEHPNVRLVRPERRGHDGSPSSPEAGVARPVPRLSPGPAHVTMAGH